MKYALHYERLTNDSTSDEMRLLILINFRAGREFTSGGFAYSGFFWFPRGSPALWGRLRKPLKCLFLLVTPARFERATYRLGICCSILLSYGITGAGYTA